jgi:hypothetical protein
VAKLFNLARMKVSGAPGTAVSVTLASAADGFLTFGSAGVADGDTITYAIEDGTAREIGRGTWNATQGQIARASVLRSTNGGSRINATAAAEVFITVAAEDIPRPVAELSAMGSMDTADLLRGYDVSTGEEVQLSILNLFAKFYPLLAEAGAPALTDRLALYTASGATMRAITLGSVFEMVTVMTEVSAVDGSADLVAIYHGATAAPRMVRTRNLVPKADASALRAMTNGVEFLTPAAIASAVAEVSLTDGASIAWDMAAGIDFALTLGGNRVMQVPSPVRIGKKGRLRVIQGGGNNTITWASVFKFDSSTAFTLSSAAGAQDIVYYDAIASTFVALMLGSKGAG